MADVICIKLLKFARTIFTVLPDEDPTCVSWDMMQHDASLLGTQFNLSTNMDAILPGY